MVRDTDGRRALFVVVIVFVFFFAVLVISGNNLDKRIRTLETVAPSINVEQALLSQGWSYECVNSVNVSKHYYIEEHTDFSNNSCRDVCITRADCIMLYNGDTSNCDAFESCLKGCPLPHNDSVVPAHVVYYNSSVCTKIVLVKYLEAK